MNNRSGEEAEFIIVGRDGDLFICQQVDEFRVPSIWYYVCTCKDCNKVISDLIHHDE